MTTTGSKRSAAIAAWTAAVAIAVPLSAPAARAAEPYKDPNTILRELAPVEYLPEHRGTERRSTDLEVRFEVGAATLTEGARRQLDALAQAMRSPALRTSRFRVAGHTDASGAAEYNKRLSRRRAAAVKAYLTARHAIAPARLETVGWGEERLKAPLTPNGAVNRRVEVTALGPFPEVRRDEGGDAAGTKSIRW